MVAPLTSAQAVLKLARANMTVISAVTYLAAAVLSTRGNVNMERYFAGWLFVILTQFMTHFLGEVADARSDTLNRYSTPITGGSGVLPADGASITMANFMGYLCGVLAALTLHYLIPSGALNVGIAIQILAWAYSAEPVKLNHRCLGEIDAAIVTNALLPYFAAAVQGSVGTTNLWWSRPLAILVVPPFLVKISLFLVLNLADRRADWATGKVTLAVWLGNRVCAHLHLALMCLAYITAAIISYLDNTPTMLLFILPSLPYGARITRRLVTEVPYSLAPLLGPALLHSTLLVWGVLLHTLVNSFSETGPRFYHVIAIIFLYISAEKVIKGRRRAAAERRKQAALEQDPIHLASLRTPKASVLSDVTDSSSEEHDIIPTVLKDVTYTDLVVVGGGIEALVCGLTAVSNGLDVLILDSHQKMYVRHLGENVHLTPSQVELLARLGVSRTYLRCMPSGDGSRNTANYDQLLVHLRTLAKNILVPGTRVSHLIEDEGAECVRVHHGALKRGQFVVARAVIGCDGVQGVISRHVKDVMQQERGRSARWNTPRALSLEAMSIDACAVASNLLQRYWAHADGHLEAFYQFERLYRR